MYGTGSRQRTGGLTRAITRSREISSCLTSTEMEDRNILGSSNTGMGPSFIRLKEIRQAQMVNQAFLRKKLAEINMGCLGSALWAELRKSKKQIAQFFSGWSAFFACRVGIVQRFASGASCADGIRGHCPLDSRDAAHRLLIFTS